MATLSEFIDGMESIGWSVSTKKPMHWIINQKGKRTNLYLNTLDDTRSVELKIDNMLTPNKGLWGEYGLGGLCFALDKLGVHVFDNRVMIANKDDVKGNTFFIQFYS